MRERGTNTLRLRGSTSASRRGGLQPQPGGARAWRTRCDAAGRPRGGRSARGVAEGGERCGDRVHCRARDGWRRGGRVLGAGDSPNESGALSMSGAAEPASIRVSS